MRLCFLQCLLQSSVNLDKHVESSLMIPSEGYPLLLEIWAPANLFHTVP